MNWESILGLLGGGLGVFILKLYADWHKAKSEDTKNVVGAWQQIADRETTRLEKLEDRVTLLEKIVLEKDSYIKELEHTIFNAGLKLPDSKYSLQESM
ncbi:MAG: hypothetical protein LBB91_05570 [Clostridiales bacterium]|jgi:hypothetical protein|nr:hypothetical protein [Clostridiales bacterium]